MLQRLLIPFMIPIGLIGAPSGHAQDLPSTMARPLHYTVRFGALVGELDPVAGEVLCNRDRDCEILLAFTPKITIRLRADPNDVRNGRAFVDCADLPCGFATGSQAIHYSSEVNDLRISTGRDTSTIMPQSLVWRSRTPIGRFAFTIDPSVADNSAR